MCGCPRRLGCTLIGCDRDAVPSSLYHPRLPLIHYLVLNYQLLISVLCPHYTPTFLDLCDRPEIEPTDDAMESWPSAVPNRLGGKGEGSIEGIEVSKEAVKPSCRLECPALTSPLGSSPSTFRVHHHSLLIMPFHTHDRDGLLVLARRIPSE